MAHKDFVTADWHFFHKGMNVSTSHWDRSEPPRDFPTLEEMNDCIIDNINAVVGRTDTLWNLGDVIFSRTGELPNLMSRIKCKDVRLILGNHDKNIKIHRINDAGKRVPNGKLGACFRDVRDKHKIKHNDIRIYLHHEPLHTWPGINIGFMHLFGHCHGNLPDRNLRCMDVGVDTNDYKPYLLDDVVETLSSRKFKNSPDIPKDHHSVTRRGLLCSIGDK